MGANEMEAEMEFKWEEFAHGRWANTHGYSLRHYLKSKSHALLSIRNDSAMVFAGGKLCATIEPFDSSHLFRLNGAIPTGYPMTDNFGVLSYAVA